MLYKCAILSGSNPLLTCKVVLYKGYEVSNIVSSGIFCYRNIGKTENGEIGRAPVAVGQANNILNSVMELDNAVGKGAKTAVDALKGVAQGSRALGYLGKGINFASKNVNPLICVSGGIKVLTSDDPASAMIQEAAALKAMFTCEKLMKANMDNVKNIGCVKGVATKFLNFCANTKGFGKLPMILKGVAFVGGSMLAYDVGHKFGTFVTDKTGMSKKS